jgi:hypothetical protein
MKRPLAHTHITVVRKRGPDQCQGYDICQLQQVRLHAVTYTTQQKVNYKKKRQSRERLVPWLLVYQTGWSDTLGSWGGSL